MKLIDDKGRLFGLINLLDLAVIIGVLAALFVGVAAWIALRQEPVELLALKPSRITAGKPVKVTAKLRNERYLTSARLHLRSDQPGAKTISLSSKVNPAVRDRADFTLPADLPAGSYSLELEAQVMDVFHRQSLQTVKNDKIKLVVAKGVTKLAFDPNCLWKLKLKTVLLSSGDGPPGLVAGNKLESRAGMSLTLAEFEPEVPAGVRDKLLKAQKEKAFALASLEVTAPFEQLKYLLADLEPSISLSCRDTSLYAVALGDVSAELDMLFYLKDDEQAGLLAKDAALATRDEQTTAVVVENFGQVDNPWLSATAVSPGRDGSPAFSVARVRLTCRPKNDGLYFGKTRLEPNRMLTFRTGDTRLKGGILSASTQPDLRTTVRVVLDNVPAHLVPLLTRDVVVTNAKGNVIAGRVKRVLDNAPLEIMTATPGVNQRKIGNDFRRLLLELELECTSNRGVLHFLGQRIDYGSNLNLTLLGHQFTATTYYGDTLPPLANTRQNLRTTVRVMLDNVPIQLVPLLTSGVRVTNAKGNIIAGRLKRVLDNAPLEIMIATPGANQRKIGNDFRRLLLELELECTSNRGVLYFLGQRIDYGGNLNLALLGHPFTATIYYGDTLPPPGKLVWEKMQVRFTNVPPEIVPWIRAGEQEYQPGKPTTWTIESVISDEPAKVLYPGADGRQAYLADHPTLREIRCRVSLRVTKIGDDLFYNGKQLKIGTTVSFNARRWSLSASLTGF